MADSQQTVELVKEKYAYNINEAAKALGLGRTKLYELIQSGEIETRKGGGRTLILAGELARWSHGLPRNLNRAA